MDQTSCERGGDFAKESWRQRATTATEKASPASCTKRWDIWVSNEPSACLGIDSTGPACKKMYNILWHASVNVSREKHQTKWPELQWPPSKLRIPLSWCQFPTLDVRCKGGYEYILVVLDHFTRFAQVYAMTNKSAKTVVEKLFNDYALKFAFLARIHHDMGIEFENQMFFQLEKLEKHLSHLSHSRCSPIRHLVGRMPRPRE